MIRVEDVTKSFGTTRAVDGLSFTVEAGEVVGLLGPNGAGKTTAMRLVTGYLAPDSGTVEVEGIPVLERATEAQRLIGYLPENNPLYRDMLVSELLQLSARLKRVPRHELGAALDFVVDAVGLDDVFYRPIGQLSKGYRQRVGIATALVHQPRILILDEPTEGLDPGQRGDIRSLIARLAEDRTIIMSTHVMQEVQAVASRVMIVSRGRLVADGSVGEVTRAARPGRTITFEAAGRGITRALDRLDKVDQIDAETVTRGRVRATITTDADVDVRPELSRLAREHEWTIWHLAEQEHRLEDVFMELTTSEEHR
jgi:ABC-2 type transport system ATP-binding protein